MSVTVTRGLAVASALATAILLLAFGASALADSNSGFGVSSFTTAVTDAAGNTYTQAGGHPYEASTTLDFNVNEISNSGGGAAKEEIEGGVKNIMVDLPPGFSGNPQAVPRCPESELFSCPPDTQVGAARVLIDAGEFSDPIYNIAPERGYPAEFGFRLDNFPTSARTFLYASVLSGGGYGLRVSSVDTPEAGIRSVSVTFWGVPADPGHDLERGEYCDFLGGGKVECEGGGQPGTSSQIPFLTNPTNCAAGPQITTLNVDPWYHPGEYQTYTATSPAVTGCEGLPFDPSISFAPSPLAEGGTRQADEPSAYTVKLGVPQSEDPEDVATPDLKDATVTLPVGVSISPSAAEGLTGCQETGAEGINLTEEQINGGGHEYEELNAVPGRCPAASILGTVEVFTPLLADGPSESAPLNGHIYLAQPKCGSAGRPACAPASATNGELYGIYLEAEGSGVIIKLKGTVAANPTNGQLTATFNENPQLPFSELKLKFKGGTRAPLANPAWCGAATTTSDLAAWSEGVGGTSLAAPLSSFEVDFDGAGEACPASVPFAPTLSAGTTSVTAGAFTPFSLTFTRGDRQQTLSQISVSTPEGLLGMVSKVPQCPEVQAQAGTCSAASQIGTTTVAAGAGTHPFYLSGQVYLTGAYKGAPFGLSIAVPANAGPFHLGNVIVRAAINVNPQTAALTITSDPLPQIIDGVPLRLQSINVTVNRSEFILNPTNCTASSVGATIQGDQGARVAVTSPFDVGDCQNLAFTPKLTASSQGKTSKANGASLTVRVVAAAGQANIGKVDLQLPKALPSRLTTLQKACSEAQFNANPAGCPQASVIGTAKAVTPILNFPLSGPGILVSHGGAAFPDVEFVLQGQGVTIILDGKTQITKGVTYSKFESVPDAPISSFEAVLPEGPHSILATDLPASANRSLCGKSLVIPTTITGQNGKQVIQNTKMTVLGCAKVKPLSRAEKLSKAMKACKKKAKKKRATCEAQARKKYGAPKPKKSHEQTNGRDH